MHGITAWNHPDPRVYHPRNLRVRRIVKRLSGFDSCSGRGYFPDTATQELTKWARCTVSQIYIHLPNWVQYSNIALGISWLCYISCACLRACLIIFSQLPVLVRAFICIRRYSVLSALALRKHQFMARSIRSFDMEVSGCLLDVDGPDVYWCALLVTSSELGDHCGAGGYTGYALPRGRVPI